MHGGSGSTDAEIKEAVDNGVIKMNIDTDTQWAYWNGVRNFVAEKHEYLQCKIGNSEGEDVPNKKYYDPRVWIRKGEMSMIDCLCISMTQLKFKDKHTRSQEPGARHQCLPFKKPVHRQNLLLRPKRKLNQ